MGKQNSTELGKGRAPVLGYFNFSQDADGQAWAKCKACEFVEPPVETMLKYNGSTTTNLLNHFQRFHPKEYADIKGEEIPTENDDVEDEPANKRPKTMRDYLHVRALTHAEQENIENSIVHMVAVDFQPVSVVENVGFRKLCRALNPAFHHINRQRATQLIHDKYEKVQPVMAEFINQADEMSLTADAWQSDALQHHLTVTAHYMVGKNLHETRLGTRPINKEDADSIAATIEGILRDWNISKEKIICVVTDNGGGMPAAIEKLGLIRIPCTAHTLNLAVNDLFQSPMPKDLFTKAQKVVSHFRDSAPSKHALDEIQKTVMNQETPLELLGWMEVRWNTRLFMLRRISRLKPAINAYWSNNDQSPILTNEDFLLIKDLVKILEAIEKITNDLSGSKYPTLSMVIPLINSAVKLLNLYEFVPQEKEQTSHIPEKYRLVSKEGQKISRELASILKNRFKNDWKPSKRPIQYDVEGHELMREATVMDARFKAKLFDDPNKAQLARLNIINQLNSIVDSNVVEDQYSEKENEPSKEMDLFDFSDLYNLSNSDEQDGGKLFDDYLAAPMLSQSSNALDQIERISMGKYNDAFVRLQRKYFCIPATSAPSERVFSSAGYISSDRRNRTGNDLLNELVFLNHALPIYEDIQKSQN